MERRKFLIGIGSASVGGSALLGSGAFTKVRSQRRARIEVAEDPDAYLGLDGCPGSPNESYTDLDEDGHLEVEMSPMNEQSFRQNPESDLGLGVNSDSFSWFDDVFEICNQGKQSVCVWVNASINPDLDPRPEEYDDEPRIRFYYLDEDGNRIGIVGSDKAVSLDVGECICVGIRTMTKGISAGDQLIENNEIIVNADADVECEEEVCPALEAEYTCTVRDPPEDGGTPIGTRHTVTNVGTGDTSYGWAILNSPGAFVDDGDFVDAGDDATFVSDASSGEGDDFAQLEGVVFWEADCTEEQETQLGLTTYSELVTAEDVSTDFDDEYGDDIPADAYATVIDGYPATEGDRTFCDELND
jgi:hypothetical protein